MNRVAKVTLNGLMIAVCLAATPLVITMFSATADAAPRTTGKPGRLEPGGRRAVQPQEVLRAEVEVR